MLDFEGWSAFDDESGGVPTGNLWHANANNGRFYAKIAVHAEVEGGTNYQTGTAFPTNPAVGSLFEFNAAGSSLTNAYSFNGTDAVTTAVRGDLFKYTDAGRWVLQSQVGSADGGGTPTDSYARTSIGTGTVTSTVGSVTLSPAIVSGDFLEFVFTLGNRPGGAFLLSADTILGLTAVDATPLPTSAVRALPFKITNNVNGLTAFGHGTVNVWFVSATQLFFNNPRGESTDVVVNKITMPGGSVSGQESPAGVNQLTADLVQVVLWKFPSSPTAVPDAPTAHWRFDDEWNGVYPADTSWYSSRAEALMNAELNPNFDDTTPAWIASEQVRRRVVGESYTYTDGGYTVVAEAGVQYTRRRRDDDLHDAAGPETACCRCDRACRTEHSRSGGTSKTRCPNGSASSRRTSSTEEEPIMRQK